MRRSRSGIPGSLGRLIGSMLVAIRENGDPGNCRISIKAKSNLVQPNPTKSDQIKPFRPVEAVPILRN